MNRNRVAILLLILVLALLAWWGIPRFPPLRAYVQANPDEIQAWEALIALVLVVLGALAWVWNKWTKQDSFSREPISTPSEPPPSDLPSSDHPLTRSSAPLVQVTDAETGRDINIATGDAKISRVRLGDSAAVRDIIETQNIIQSLASEERLPTLHSIDPPPANFTGREAELDELQASMSGPGVHISGVAGMGGVGKTALARALAQCLHDDYPDAQILLNMRGTREQPRTPAEAMATVIHAFHPDATLPEGEGGLRRTYLSVLHAKRALLLLDDVKDKEQVEMMMPPPTCGLIITSRQHFVLPDLGLHPLRLDTLPPADATALLRRTARRLINDMEAARLAELCGYLPLALRLAGSALAERLDLSPVEYATQLRDSQRRIELVEASLTLSYNLLDQTLQQRWRTLAVFPATFDRFAAAAVWGLGTVNETDIAEVTETLGTLVRYSLVEWLDAEGRYRLHDLARLFADRRLADSERDLVQRRHTARFLSVLDTADGLFRQSGEVRQAIDYYQEALAIAREIGDRRSEGMALGSLAISYRYMGEVRQAIDYSEQQLAITREIGDQHGEGMALGNMGIAYFQLGEVRQAIDHYQEALAIAREIGDRRSEGMALGALGIFYRDIGDVPQAFDHFQQRLAVAREIGDRRGEGIALGNLGNVYFQLGQAPQAIDYYQQQLTIANEIGDRRDEGIALSNLGITHSKMGEVQQAIDYYEQHLKIAREIGDLYHEGTALDNLGNAYADLGEVRQAIDYYEQQLTIVREIGNRRGEGNALFNMSLALDALGERQQAILLAEAALHIFEQIEDPNAEKVRRQLAAWRGEEPPP